MNKIRWTEKEINYLKDAYVNEETTNEDLTTNINRSFKAIQEKANTLHLYRPNHVFYNYWTKEEIAHLKKEYDNPFMSFDDLCQKLNRTKVTIQNKAYQLKLNGAIPLALRNSFRRGHGFDTK